MSFSNMILIFSAVTFRVWHVALIHIVQDQWYDYGLTYGFIGHYI